MPGLNNGDRGLRSSCLLPGEWKQTSLFVVAGLNYLASAIKTVGADVVPAVSLATGLVHGQGCATEGIV